MIPRDAPALVRANDRPYLLAGAERWLAVRDARYPSQVEAGTMAQDAAVAKLELTRCLIAQWRWVNDPAAPLEPDYGDKCPFGAPYWQLAGEIAADAVIARARADRRPDDVQAAGIAALYEALAWWQVAHGDSGTPRIVFWTDLERRMRHRAEPLREAA